MILSLCLLDQEKPKDMTNLFSQPVRRTQQMEIAHLLSRPIVTSCHILQYKPPVLTVVTQSPTPWNYLRVCPSSPADLDLLIVFKSISSLLFRFVNFYCSSSLILSSISSFLSAVESITELFISVIYSVV